MLTEEIVNSTKSVANGLHSLQEDHLNLIHRYEGNDDSKEQVQIVKESLQLLETGIAESSLLLDLNAHFEIVESERTVLRLEVHRISDENDWLRDELSETQHKLQEALSELTELQEEKRRWEFSEELKAASSENNLRPITPSKIPVGSWRVEEEKAINLALIVDSNKRSLSPAPSKLPIGAWRSKVSMYKNVMEKKEILEKEASSDREKRSYFKLNAVSSPTLSKIPSR